MTGPDPEYNPSSPAGQIESVGGFAVGLTHLKGWRRTAARWFVLLLLIMPLAFVTLGQLLK